MRIEYNTAQYSDLNHSPKRLLEDKLSTHPSHAALLHCNAPALHHPGEGISELFHYTVLHCTAHPSQLTGLSKNNPEVEVLFSLWGKTHWTRLKNGTSWGLIHQFFVCHFTIALPASRLDLILPALAIHHCLLARYIEGC